MWAAALLDARTDTPSPSTTGMPSDDTREASRPAGGTPRGLDHTMLTQ